MNIRRDHGRCIPKWQLSVVVSAALRLLCHCFVPVSTCTCTNKPTPCAKSARELGSPNASRVLHGLGLADELAKLGVRPGAHHQRRWDNGRTLLKTSLGDTVIEAFGFPHYQSHRADVLSMLIAALPTERLHIGHHLIAFADRGDRVDAEFENGERITTDARASVFAVRDTEI